MITSANHSFCICAYKDNPNLPALIESLRSQTSNQSTIYMATSTPTPYVQEIAQRYDLPLYVNTGQKGIAQDWNFGISCARTQLVTVAHQDDIYHPRFVEQVISTFNAYGVAEASISAPAPSSAEKTVLLTYTDYAELRGEQHVTRNTLLTIKRILNAPLARRALNARTWWRRRTLSLGNPVCCPSVTFNLAALKQPIFDTTYSNSCDYLTWEQLSRQQGRFVYIPEILMSHRIYAESTTTAKIADGSRAREDLEILGKFWPAWIARLIMRYYVKGEQSNQL